MASIRLERFGEGDLWLVERLMGDSAMTEHLGGPESAKKLEKRHRRYTKPGSGMFKIVDADTDEALGSVGFWEREWQGEQVYETGWSVLPEFQGRGIASRATALAIDLARQEGKHHFLHAYPSVENGPSNAICRKLAFTLLGEYEFEFPPGNRMRCNDWRLDLRAAPDPCDSSSVRRRPGAGPMCRPASPPSAEAGLARRSLNCAGSAST
jgi:RimJ/RimL family protein N-acetyltransferase